MLLRGSTPIQQHVKNILQSPRYVLVLYHNHLHNFAIGTSELMGCWQITVVVLGSSSDVTYLLSDYPDYAPIDLFVDYYVLIYLSLSLVSSYGRMIVLVMMMVMVMMMLASDQRWAGLGWLAGWRAGWLGRRTLGCAIFLILF